MNKLYELELETRADAAQHQWWLDARADAEGGMRLAAFATVVAGAVAFVLGFGAVLWIASWCARGIQDTHAAPQSHCYVPGETPGRGESPCVRVDQ